MVPSAKKVLFIKKNSKKLEEGINYNILKSKKKENYQQDSTTEPKMT
jgi:hypothetical protein